MDSTGAAAPSTAQPTTTLRASNRAQRNYRVKPRDHDDIEQSEHDLMDTDKNETDQRLRPSTETSSNSALTSSTNSTLHPYHQSQEAQSLGEVYPGLARLSFLDQDEGSGAAEDSARGDPSSSASLLGTKKPRRPLQQRHQQQSTEGEQQRDAVPMEVDNSTSTVKEAMWPNPPPGSSPSAFSSETGSSLVEVKETGSQTKGRGLFSAAKEVLQPGKLVFKELGYCQVVHDSSLSQVCSACFKDAREESDKNDNASSSATDSQRRLVRCAGCKVTCQTNDWKLHHRLECQGIQKSMANPVMKEVWTKHTTDTTSARALCRMMRRRERVRLSAAYKAEHKKLDAAQKQVNEVYFSGLDQKEEEWLDENGGDWIDRFLSTGTAEASNDAPEDSSQFAKTMAIVMSCVTLKEDRQSFLSGHESERDASAGVGGLGLYRKLASYAFSITNMQTTTAVGVALYIQCMPFMNHSCIPNCIYIFKGSRVECRVIRDIQPGEEMTISYIDQIGMTKERQRQLKSQYHFTCDCPLCRYFPANPLTQPEEDALRNIVSGPLPEPLLDPKQGFVCLNTTCLAADGPRPILAVESQLNIYNKVELKCKECGHISELTQELVQENEESAQRLITGFVREMNGGSLPSHKSKSNSRNFELAKATIPESNEQNTGDDAVKPTVVGGLRTVQAPSERAMQNYEDAYKVLTGVLPTATWSAATGNTPSVLNDDAVCRSQQHRLVRQLVQVGFDEAVSHKNWIFALHRSIELERILNATYIGHHPSKAIQSYYTCKISNLLANLLLEESTVDVEESGKEDEDKEQDMLDSDDERELKAWRDAMRQSKGHDAVGTKVGNGSMQERFLKKKQKDQGDTSAEQVRREKKGLEQAPEKRMQPESSQKVMRDVKALLPSIEDPRILQQFRVIWGKDGKLVSRYRIQADSLKQALHYAELPFAKNSTGTR
ncbi:SET and MYND domain-containing protein 3 [Dissophora globulifera]|uniref:SET and MYND domain-containing protein 3 n=1 Tax=Dissophora globulifera TaxID=979702 RepID=A0A9P6UZ81_9FUNG|nr:SET and MYND domain-containing protein 3 [Dissophora globulifera]